MADYLIASDNDEDTDKCAICTEEAPLIEVGECESAMRICRACERDEVQRACELLARDEEYRSLRGYTDEERARI